MKREVSPFGQDKRKPNRDKKRNFFDDDGYTPNKKEILNQYKRKQKHRNIQNWDE
jgi:hypothetical protein